jgi:hypothetical protein
MDVQIGDLLSVIGKERYDDSVYGLHQLLRKGSELIGAQDAHHPAELIEAERKHGRGCLVTEGIKRLG